MTQVAATVSALLGMPPPAQAKGEPIEDIVSDLKGARRVALLALDAFGTYAWGLWRGEMPFLDSLHTRRSITLRSVMPSITPVNFATMVTGTDLEGHRIETFDHDFACETLFDVVRRAGGQSAGVGLTGFTGTKLLGRHADIDGDGGEPISDDADDGVADKIIEIVEAYQPEFLIAQLGKTDDVFHREGPSSPAVVPMLRETDVRMKKLVEYLQARGYGIVVLADHGQHDIEGAPEGQMKGTHGTDSPKDVLVPCTWIS